jgi:hypothetical protein
MYLILDVNRLIVLEVHLKNFVNEKKYIYKNEIILPGFFPRSCEHLTRVITLFLYGEKLI